MDIHMPGETGTDAALTIKQDPATKDIRIAFLSNLKDPWPQTTPARHDMAKAIGMEDFIDKTEDLDITVSKVRRNISAPAEIKNTLACRRDSFLFALILFHADLLWLSVPLLPRGVT